MSHPKIVIDPGHGGNDPGASGNNLVEKELTLKIALALREILVSRWECDIRMTREEDISVSYSSRVDTANHWPADFFYSVHCNGHSNPEANGWETFIYQNANQKNAAFQNIIHKEIYDYLLQFNVRDRGKKEANFFVLRNTNMSAMLAEYLFVTGDQDSQLLKQEEILSGMAQATARGIAEALRLPLKEKEVKKMTNAVVILRCTDFPVAEVLAAKINAPIFIREAMEELQNAQNIFVCGGETESIREIAPEANIVDLSGADRFETSKNVYEYIREL